MYAFVAHVQSLPAWAVGSATMSEGPNSVKYKAMLGLIQVCGMSQAIPTQPLPQFSSTAAGGRTVGHTRRQELPLNGSYDAKQLAAGMSGLFSL
jgi:hypothetical protein